MAFTIQSKQSDFTNNQNTVTKCIPPITRYSIEHVNGSKTLSKTNT